MLPSLETGWAMRPGRPLKATAPAIPPLVMLAAGRAGVLLMLAAAIEVAVQKRSRERSCRAAAVNEA